MKQLFCFFLFGGIVCNEAVAQQDDGHAFLRNMFMEFCIKSEWSNSNIAETAERLSAERIISSDEIQPDHIHLGQNSGFALPNLRPFGDDLHDIDTPDLLIFEDVRECQIYAMHREGRSKQFLDLFDQDMLTVDPSIGRLEFAVDPGSFRLGSEPPEFRFYVLIRASQSAPGGLSLFYVRAEADPVIGGRETITMSVRGPFQTTGR